MRNIYVLSEVRTAIGTFGETLKDKLPAELGAAVTRAALDRAGVSPETIGHVIFGQIMPTEPADADVARVAAVNAGVPHGTPALSVDRLCGSGLQAIVTAAQMAMLGNCKIAVAGGTEVMSRVPYYAPGMRWGQHLGDGALVDALVGALTTRLASSTWA